MWSTNTVYSCLLHSSHLVHRVLCIPEGVQIMIALWQSHHKQPVGHQQAKLNTTNLLTTFNMHVQVIHYNWKTPCPYIPYSRMSTGKGFAVYCYNQARVYDHFNMIIEFSSPTTITINIILPHATIQVSWLEETIITITGVSMSQSSTFKHQTCWLMPNIL